MKMLVVSALLAMSASSAFAQDQKVACYDQILKTATDQYNTQRANLLRLGWSATDYPEASTMTPDVTETGVTFNKGDGSGFFYGVQVGPNCTVTPVKPPRMG